MRTTLTMVMLFVFLLAICLFFTGDLKSTAASGISTGFESSEGYMPGDVDGQNGWEHDQSPGSWQVETDVVHSGAQAIRSPLGFDDTEARVTTKSFPTENTGDMVFYMRRDDNNLQRNNFYVGFTTDHGENPEVVVCMCEEGIIMQNTITGGFVILANPFTLGQWYRIHFKWNASSCQASLNDGSFISISNPANMGFARIYIMARGQAVAYVDDIQDLMTPTIPVGIDIKPVSFPNSVNLGSNGTVPVAILSTSDFDATTVNPTTITLAGAQVRLRGRGTPMASFQDVDGDGLLDLVVHVSTEALQLSEGDTEAVLEGQTFGGTHIRGVDSVRVIP